MSKPFENCYHTRKVAATSSKACFICYKATATVLVSSDGKADFFYVCDTHLQDAAFATAHADPEVEAAKKKRDALKLEIEQLEKQWAERQKDKKKKDKKAEDKKDDDKEGSGEKQKTELDELDEIANRKPRTYTLNNDIYKIRLANYRDKQRSKQTAQLLSKSTLFPSVPTHSPDTTPSATPPPPPSGV